MGTSKNYRPLALAKLASPDETQSRTDLLMMGRYTGELCPIFRGALKSVGLSVLGVAAQCCEVL